MLSDQGLWFKVNPLSDDKGNDGDVDIFIGANDELDCVVFVLENQDTLNRRKESGARQTA